MIRTYSLTYKDRLLMFDEPCLARAITTASIWVFKIPYRRAISTDILRLINDFAVALPPTATSADVTELFTLLELLR